MASSTPEATMAPFRYRKPGYLALNVTDLERSLWFYRDVFGLQLEERRGDEAAFLRCSADHHNLVLYRAAEPGIKRMAFELESAEDLRRAREYLLSLGWTVKEVPKEESQTLKQGETLRFRIPDCSLTFEFYAEMARGATPFQPTVAKIQRLGHVLIRARHAEAVVRTLTEKLNFVASDHFGDQSTFLRCFPNPYHHSFGVARGEEDAFHHVNFMVSDMDDIGRATNRMRKNGVEIVYGPGRHDISNSIFLYCLDPDGMTAEYSFGMEEFPEQGARAARLLPKLPEILDAWGGVPSPKYAKRGKMET